MSELTYTVIRFGLVALLWLFVLSLAAVLRRDIYGTRISRRSQRDQKQRNQNQRNQNQRAPRRPDRRQPAAGPAPPTAPVGAAPAGAAAAGAAAAGAASVGAASVGAASAGAAAAGTAPRQAQRQPRRRREPTTLVVTEGQLAGTSLPLGRQGVLVGRGPECTLVLDDEFASSRHARIFPRAEGWFVEDQGSRNGTTVNGRRITGAVPVQVGAVIRVGRTTLELRG